MSQFEDELKSLKLKGCVKCYGSGQLDDLECPKCKGTGFHNVADEMRTELVGYDEIGSAIRKVKDEPLYTLQQMRQITIAFYYWWHNQPGTNTQQGFDTWWALPETEEVIELIQGKK